MILNPNTITHISPDQVLLTFDDGPRPRLTPRLLDTLGAFEVQACFFIYGKRGAEHRSLLRRIVDEGHELGNHTWNHIRLSKTSIPTILKDIRMAQASIQDITGRAVRFFRPPYGDMTPDMVNMIQDEFNMQTMMWSFDPSDWSSPGANVIYERVTEGVRGGDILLMHERNQTAEALPHILTTFRERSVKTMKVADLE